MTNHTPTPWKLGEFEEYLGYDCMTAGIRCGPALLDGSDYGQRRCTDIEPETKARMLADAEFIVRACNSYDDMLDALELFRKAGIGNSTDFEIQAQAFNAMHAAIAKAKGDQP